MYIATSDLEALRAERTRILASQDPATHTLLMKTGKIRFHTAKAIHYGRYGATLGIIGETRQFQKNPNLDQLLSGIINEAYKISFKKGRSKMLARDTSCEGGTWYGTSWKRMMYHVGLSEAQLRRTLKVLENLGILRRYSPRQHVGEGAGRWISQVFVQVDYAKVYDLAIGALENASAFFNNKTSPPAPNTRLNRPFYYRADTSYADFQVLKLERTRRRALLGLQNKADTDAGQANLGSGQASTGNENHRQSTPSYSTFNLPPSVDHLAVTSSPSSTASLPVCLQICQTDLTYAPVPGAGLSEERGENNNPASEVATSTTTTPIPASEVATSTTTTPIPVNEMTASTATTPIPAMTVPELQDLLARTSATTTPDTRPIWYDPDLTAFAIWRGFHCETDHRDEGIPLKTLTSIFFSTPKHNASYVFDTSPTPDFPDEDAVKMFLALRMLLPEDQTDPTVEILMHIQRLMADSDQFHRLSFTNLELYQKSIHGGQLAWGADLPWQFDVYAIKVMSRLLHSWTGIMRECIKARDLSPYLYADWVVENYAKMLRDHLWSFTVGCRFGQSWEEFKARYSISETIPEGYAAFIWLMGKGKPYLVESATTSPESLVELLEEAQGYISQNNINVEAVQKHFPELLPLCGFTADGIETLKTAEKRRLKPYVEVVEQYEVLTTKFVGSRREKTPE